MAQHVTFPDKFDYAVRYVDRRYGKLEECKELEDVKKLALYALRRQAEDGKCTESAPYMWNVTERFKHQAWSQLGTMSRFEAMFQYTALLDQLSTATWMEEQYGVDHPGDEEDACVRQTPVDAPLGAGEAVDSTTVPATSKVAGGSLPSSRPTTPAAQDSPMPRPPLAPVGSATSSIDDAIRSHDVAFDDVDISSEVSAENVQRLVREVIRLRQMLHQNGISYANSGRPAADSSVPTGARRRPAPGRLSSRPRRGSGSSQARPQVSGTAALAAAESAAGVSSPQRRTRVSRSPPRDGAAPRLGWMQWLGVASVPKEPAPVNI